MAFTEHRFNRDDVAAAAGQMQARLQANTGSADLLAHAAGVIAGRLERDRAAYRWYGPWWWALKDALRRAGRDYGTQSDPLVRRAYGFEDDLQTVVAADAFRDWYMATQFVGTQRFMLDPSTGEHYDLWDADMEGAT